jgi:hypothetical protein
MYVDGCCVSIAAQGWSLEDDDVDEDGGGGEGDGDGEEGGEAADDLPMLPRKAAGARRGDSALMRRSAAVAH